MLGVFDHLIAEGSSEAGKTAEDWVLSVLDPSYHCHASLLNSVATCKITVPTAVFVRLFAH